MTGYCHLIKLIISSSVESTIFPKASWLFEYFITYLDSMPAHTSEMLHVSQENKKETWEYSLDRFWEESGPLASNLLLNNADQVSFSSLYIRGSFSKDHSIHQVLSMQIILTPCHYSNMLWIKYIHINLLELWSWAYEILWIVNYSPVNFYVYYFK